MKYLIALISLSILTGCSALKMSVMDDAEIVAFHKSNAEKRAANDARRDLNFAIRECKMIAKGVSSTTHRSAWGLLGAATAYTYTQKHEGDKGDTVACMKSRGYETTGYNEYRPIIKEDDDHEANN